MPSRPSPHTASPRPIATLTTQGLALATLASFALYLGWRAGATLDGADLVTAWALWCTELLVAMELGAEIVRRWPVSPFHHPAGRRCADRSVGESIDRLSVIIPVDTEHEDLVRLTVLASAQLEPEAIVVVCSTPRPDVARLVGRFNRAYYRVSHCGDPYSGTRLKQINSVNSVWHALGSPWLLLLAPGDAPSPTLREHIRVEPLRAVVVLGRRIADSNSFDMAAGLLQQHQLRLEVDQPNLDARGLTQWQDLPALIRTDALRHIGGLVEDEIALIRASGRRMLRSGWSIGYGPPNAVVAPGAATLAAALASSYYNRRADLGVLLRHRGHTSLAAKLLSLSALSPVINAVRRLTQILVTAFVLITGAVPASMSVREILMVVIPVYGLRGVVRRALRQQRASMWPLYLHELRTLSTNLLLIPGLRRASIGLQQSIRQPRRDLSGIGSILNLKIQIGLALTLDFAMLAASIGTILNRSTGAKGLLYFVFMTIAGWHVIGLTEVLAKASTRRQQRHHNRIRVRFDLTIDTYPARAVNLSSGGIGLATPYPVARGQTVKLAMNVDGKGPIAIKARVEYVDPLADSGGLNIVGLQFIGHDSEDIDRLYLYCGSTWAFERLRAPEPARFSQAP